MRVIGVIQARTGSERLPKKALAPLAGAPAIEWLYRRASRASALDGVVVAIPEGDAALIEWANTAGAPVVEGPEEDVLARFCAVVRRFDADAVIRMTADCPLLDPALIDDLARRTGTRAGCDYYFVEGYPRGCGDVELVSTSALLRADVEARSAADREHVITYVANRPDEFDVVIDAAPQWRRRPDLRVCIDEPADLEVVTAVIAELGIDEREPSVDAVIQLLDSRPDLVAINAHVQQRS